MALLVASSSALVGLIASPALTPIRSGGLGIGCCAADLSTDSPLARLTNYEPFRILLLLRFIAV